MRFRDLDPYKVVQALEELVRRRLAIRIRKQSEDWYDVSPEAKEKPDNELLYEMLKPKSDVRKKDVDAHSSAIRSSQVLLVLSIVLLMISGMSLIWFQSTLDSLSFALVIVFGVSFAIAIVLGVYFERRARKHGKLVSREEELAIDLITAYEVYNPFITGKVSVAPRKAKNLVKKTASGLEKVMEAIDRRWETPSTPWRMLSLECERISQLGADLRMRILPRMTKREHAANVGNVLLKLARFLFEPSPSNMMEASKLMSGLSAQKAKFFERLSIAITTRFWPRLAFCLVFVLGTGAITLYATSWNWVAAGVVGTWLGVVTALMTWSPIERVVRGNASG
jgi:hypothetical protein